MAVRLVYPPISDGFGPSFTKRREYLPLLQIYIRDLDSPFGTFVNDVKIKNIVKLQTGDIVVCLSSAWVLQMVYDSLCLQSLGTQIPRNSNTPGYITDEQLKPVIARVTLMGIGS